MFDPAVFRMYDIRGVAGTQITMDLAYAIGRSLGTRIVRSGAATAVVGHDVRLSSPDLAASACRGLLECGLTVHFLGQTATPVVYHALHHMKWGGGIMVTGSHNPKHDNGLKLCLGKDALYGEAVSSLRGQSVEQDWETGDGQVIEEDYLPTYLDHVLPLVPVKSGVKVAIDTGNGVMGPIVMEAFRRFEIQVTPLFIEPDGEFPNHLPDPEVPKYMKALGRAVLENGCVCGLGFDGDGDRVAVLDESGRKISADWVLSLFARVMLKQHPGGKVRFDVKCSDFLDEDIRAHGGEPVMGVTGHSLLKRDIKDLDAILGGELSGHIVFNRGFYPTDDSLYCALKFLGILDSSGSSTSELFSDFPRLLSTAEIKLPCADAEKFEVVDALVKRFRKDFSVHDIDGARVRLPGAWFLVRASNTTPNLTVRFEAQDQDALEAAKATLMAGLAGLDSVTTTPLDELEVE